jgi:hypothetical protein
MSSVVSVKISSKVKKEMERLKDKIEWPEEIRQFIENRVEKARREQSARKVQQLLKDMPGVPKGTASKLVREDRDNGH